jgi:hypothetical protein
LVNFYAVEVRTIIDSLANLENSTTPAISKALLSSKTLALGGKWELSELPESESAENSGEKSRRKLKKQKLPANMVWTTWMPLRNVVGERARGPSGGDSEVKLGFRWQYPSPPGITSIQGLLHEPDGLQELQTLEVKTLELWKSGRFVLDGPEQILWMREGGAGSVGRKMSVRFAEIRDETSNLGSLIFSVTNVSGSKFIGRAIDDEDHWRWLSALIAASGMREEEEPKFEQSLCMRHRWLLTMAAFTFMLLVVGALAAGLALRTSIPVNLFAKDAMWGICKGSSTPANKSVNPLWCVGCDCFSRCVFGSSGGLLLLDPLHAFRACSDVCDCSLPLPKSVKRYNAS